jgi:hypothetical protein
MTDETGSGSRGFSALAALALGVVLGVAATILLPRYLAPYLPRVFSPATSVDGEVLDKSMEADRLLLKLSTPQGVALVTFTERQKEIDLLVDAGDTVTLSARGYEPFLLNPPLERVRKPEPGAVGAEPPAARPSGPEPDATPPITTAPTPPVGTTPAPKPGDEPSAPEPPR